MKNYKNKIVFVVGGSTGLGKAVAREFVAKGAHVIIFSRTKSRLIQAISDLERHRSAEKQIIAYQQMDITDEDQVTSGLTQIMDKMRAPDVVINCVDAADAQGLFENSEALAFHHAMQTNIYGVRHLVATLLPKMKIHGGSIVNTTSLSGFVGRGGQVQECASKFALLGFSEALRAELKPLNINLSLFCHTREDLVALEGNVQVTKVSSLKHADRTALSLISGMEKGQFLIMPKFGDRIRMRAKRWFPRITAWYQMRSFRLNAYG